jgi:hypothetical protein
LRFALIVMVNFHGDSHPEGGAHAGRTKNTTPAQGAGAVEKDSDPRKLGGRGSASRC